MSEPFDPYHKWLGIPPKDQPPHHYRLLAIDLFESDPDVIAAAADQRMMHVRSFQTGRHAAISQAILNEIAAARICLLSSEKKAAYDRQLQARMGLEADAFRPPPDRLQDAPESPLPPPLAPVVSPRDYRAPPQLGGVLPRLRSRRRTRVWQVLAAMSAAALLSAAILAVLLTGGDSAQVAGGDAGRQPSGKSPAVDAPPVLPGPERAGGRGPQKPNHSQRAQPQQATLPQTTVAPEPSGPSKPASAEPQPEPAKPASGSGLSTGEQVKPTPGGPAEAPSQKLPVPDTAAQLAAEGRLRTTFADASATDLLKAGRAPQQAPHERFVLLRLARDWAVASGDVGTALQAVDEIAGRYQIDAPEMQAETLADLAEAATTASTYRAVAESGLALLDQATASGAHDLAKRLAPIALSAARKTGDLELARRVTLRIVEVQNMP